DFTRQTGELTYVSRAPQKRQEVWRAAGVVPRGVDREISEMMHRTTVGTDQEAEHILDQALRVALGSGWGGSMLATDLSDILFGTPSPLPAEANLGVLRAEAVNVVVHGHEPLLPEALVQVLAEPELQAEARAAGAEGINLVGMCCTGNEALMRHGIHSAGNFLHQELAILTGAVDAMVVDVQCVLEALAALARQFHTRLITTSPKARIAGAEHLELNEERALEVAREIFHRAIAAYRERREEVTIPPHKADLIAGFSHEYLEYMLGGRYRRSFWPLVDNISNGRLLGVAAVVGCNNPRIPQDSSSLYAIKELIANNVLVVTTGCTAVAAGKHGLLDPAMLDLAGPGLREVCEAVGIGPVLHLGSCVDNSRILTVLSALVATGGLGSDISDLPAVGLCPEWMSEKALEIGTYFAGSGATVLFGGVSPVSGSRAVVEIMTERWQARYGGRLEFVGDPAVLVSKALETLHRKRQALGIDVQRQRVLFDMDSRRQLA
ncbi:MAG TPA: carbon monoxide dehydrogenase, partial [Firmicutes bacterium]|nr:carbon monoxide dehydrogenase [Bacillota bacterium]